MARAYGSSAQLLGLTEASYGVAPSSDFVKLPFISSSLGSMQPLLADDTIGNGRDPLAPSRDVITVDGDIVVPVDVRNIGFWLTGLLGEPVTTGASPILHTFKTGAASLPSRSLEIGHPQVPRFFMELGCLVNSMAFDFAPQGTTRATVGILAQGETAAAATAGGTPTTATYERFSQFQGTIKRNGASLTNITAATLTYTNNAEAVRVIRSDGKIEGVDPTIAALTGSITARFADTTLIADATSGSAIELEFAYTIDANKSLVITVHEVYLPKPKIAIAGPGGVEATFEYQAALDASEGCMATFELTNDVADYT